MYKDKYELNKEVEVEIFKGAKFTGKIVDVNDYQTVIWVERAEDSEWFMVDVMEDKVVFLDEKERAPEGLKDLSTIKAEYKEELAEMWNKDVEYHNVMVFNSEEDDAEVWDCEFNTKLEDGERITIYFGTFYNEQDAIAHARTMRTKLKRSYDITDKVTVYTC